MTDRTTTKRPALIEPGSYVGGAVITGYGGCHHPDIIVSLNALPFYWIQTQSVSFCSHSALLICETPRDAIRAANLLQWLFPDVIQNAEAGKYENTEHGWVEISFHASPWYS